MKLQRQFANGPDQPCTHVDVIHTGVSPEQNFADDLIETAQREGWATLEGDTLTLKTGAEPLRYKVLQGPGYFCKSTRDPIPVSERAWLRFRLANDSSQSRPEALAWLAGKGLPADDYDISAQYTCVLDAAQHARFRAVKDIAGNAVAAHTLQGA